jgi:hypothetical protein
MTNQVTTETNLHIYPTNFKSCFQATTAQQPQPQVLEFPTAGMESGADVNSYSTGPHMSHFVVIGEIEANQVGMQQFRELCCKGLIITPS